MLKQFILQGLREAYPYNFRVGGVLNSTFLIKRRNRPSLTQAVACFSTKSDMYAGVIGNSMGLLKKFSFHSYNFRDERGIF